MGKIYGFIMVGFEQLFWGCEMVKFWAKMVPDEVPRHRKPG